MKPEPYRRRSLVPGIAISLSLHAGLLVWVMMRHPAPPVAAPARWLTVSLLAQPAIRPQPEIKADLKPDIEPGVRPRRRPASPPREPAPQLQAEARQSAAAALPATQPPDQQQAPAPAAITLMPGNPADAPDPFAAQPAPQPGKFDTGAALRSARKLAIAKAGKDDPAVAQLKDHPINDLASESAVGKDMKKAARGSCLMAGAGAGILAPLAIAAMVLTDKKDHGCKW